MASYDELGELDDIEDLIDDVYDYEYADIRKAEGELSGYDVYRQWIEPEIFEKMSLSPAQLRQRINAAKSRARKMGRGAKIGAGIAGAAALGAGAYGVRRRMAANADARMIGELSGKGLDMGPEGAVPSTARRRAATAVRNASSRAKAGARGLPGRVKAGARSAPGRVMAGARSAPGRIKAIPGQVRDLAGRPGRAVRGEYRERRGIRDINAMAGTPATREDRIFNQVERGVRAGRRAAAAGQRAGRRVVAPIGRARAKRTARKGSVSEYGQMYNPD